MNRSSVIRVRILSVLVGLFFWINAQGALEIEITQGVEAGIPVAVVPFEWKGSGVPPHFVSDIVEADLRRSGRFLVKRSGWKFRGRSVKSLSDA